MNTFPNSPRLLKGGIVVIDPDTSAVLRVIALQYNPDTLTRTLQMHAAGSEGDRLEALRIKGPPNETIKLDAEIDATDQLEASDKTTTKTTTTGTYGLLAQLSALETLVYPTAGELLGTNALAQIGTLEIAPAESPLTLFVWGRTRVLPVRITDFSITEEAFDTSLNPIRAKVSLGMRVLSVFDLGFDHRGGNLFMAYLQNKERLARLSQSAALSALGITGI